MAWYKREWHRNQRDITDVVRENDQRHVRMTEIEHWFRVGKVSMIQPSRHVIYICIYIYICVSYKI